MVCSGGACAVSCGAGTTNCAGACQNLQTDRQNCGRCGAVCGAGEICVAGACAVSCPAGQVACGGVCANTSTDPANCGRCGAACFAGQLCVGGVCAATCGAGLTVCGGACTNVSLDPSNCGACGAACALTNATPFCLSGRCGVAACATGFGDCNGVATDGCETNVTADGTNCGRCGARCGAGQFCAGGACVALRQGQLAACNANVTLAVRGDNRLIRSWGYNGFSNLGTGSGSPSSSPTAVDAAASIGAVVAVDGGTYHACAVRADGSVWCWGYNGDYQLGDISAAGTRAAPGPVIGLAGATAIASTPTYNCALLGNGTVRCWGRGYLGDVATSSASATPVLVSGITDATAISAYFTFACALLSGGTVRCWGENLYGQLGDGTTATRGTPVTVAGLSGVVAIAPGFGHACALLSDGTVRCWGNNSSGQLGPFSGSSTSPVAVAGLSSVVGITAGYTHTCAALSDGTARCWGANDYGQLGNGTCCTAGGSPGVVSGLTGVVAIDAGAYHTCALRADGTARCWGLNLYGGLGDGTTTNRNAPVTVTGFPHL
ncbi:MAG: hypothetical protein U0326_17530 [Polyangiales bacterium]